VFRELKLLVDHRDDLVDARRRTQQRLRWHLHALDPTFAVPLRMLSRSSHLERVSRWLARHSGIAPVEASSGRTQRHRLDRSGNRQLNAAFYRIAITQARYHPTARAYLERKKAEGKSRREAIRCLKRLLVRVVFNILKASPALTKEQRWTAAGPHPCKSARFPVS
jgi:transposase